MERAWLESKSEYTHVFNDIHLSTQKSIDTDTSTKKKGCKQKSNIWEPYNRKRKTLCKNQYDRNKYTNLNKI